MNNSLKTYKYLAHDCHKSKKKLSQLRIQEYQSFEINSQKLLCIVFKLFLMFLIIAKSIRKWQVSRIISFKIKDNNTIYAKIYHIYAFMNKQPKCQVVKFSFLNFLENSIQKQGTQFKNFMTKLLEKIYINEYIQLFNVKFVDHI